MVIDEIFNDGEYDEVVDSMQVGDRLVELSNVSFQIILVLCIFLNILSFLYSIMLLNSLNIVVSGFFIFMM